MLFKGTIQRFSKCTKISESECMITIMNYKVIPHHIFLSCLHNYLVIEHNTSLFLSSAHNFFVVVIPVVKPEVTCYGAHFYSDSSVRSCLSYIKYSDYAKKVFVGGCSNDRFPTFSRPTVKEQSEARKGFVSTTCSDNFPTTPQTTVILLFTFSRGPVP